MKKYLVKYSIYDGEHEYGDHVVHELDPNKVYYKEGSVMCIDEVYVLNTIMYLDDPEDCMKDYDGRGKVYELPNRGDYRLYELYSVKEIDAEDIEILNKYGI